MPGLGFRRSNGFDGWWWEVAIGRCHGRWVSAISRHAVGQSGGGAMADVPRVDSTTAMREDMEAICVAKSPSWRWTSARAVVIAANSDGWRATEAAVSASSDPGISDTRLVGLPRLRRLYEWLMVGGRRVRGCRADAWPRVQVQQWI
ncbi:Mediator of RNA polymerase II transcription subunit 25 [Zea mays]|jgi:hypothetical protein|uniref:Mediator of RNA polymerase II transcription subunit 25 n=1 Tax=Zea mays TaxID=4577 RepID=A0A1D6ENW4_MAIZE|nr:Mediator of RNA polymerase II transcription subunit 25 [Zea mays]